MSHLHRIPEISYNVTNMSKQLFKLIKTIDQVEKEKSPPSGEVISVNDTVSKAASIYETVRNTLEYDEVHRLRRNAIRRILKRRLADDEGSEEVAQELLHELIWARYLPNEEIPVVEIGKVGKILAKYRALYKALVKLDPEQASKMTDWLNDLLSTEIEYHLDPPTKQEALASYAYNVLRSKFEWQSELVTSKDRELQLYLAIHRTYLRSNLATLRYRALVLYYPYWPKADEKLIKEIADNLITVHNAIEKQVNHPAAESLSRLIRRYSVMFNVLCDVISNNPSKAEETLRDPDALKKAARSAAKARYKDFHLRLRRSVVRAVIFLFITKMLLALVIELPYDVAVLQTTNFVPLLTNIIFFPILLGVIGTTVGIPQKKNTQEIIKYLHIVLYGEGDMTLVYRSKKPWSHSTLGQIFNGIYWAMFGVSYGLVAWFLHTIHFNGLSIAIFLFFLSLVMFFGIKLRLSNRDLIILKRKRGLFGTIFDLFFLPIIRAGRWMALRAPRINVFLFFLDYIVEAPFKMAIAMVEGWLAFMREKKEEIE